MSTAEFDAAGVTTTGKRLDGNSEYLDNGKSQFKKRDYMTTGLPSINHLVQGSHCNYMLKTDAQTDRQCGQLCGAEVNRYNFVLWCPSLQGTRRPTELLQPCQDVKEEFRVRSMLEDVRLKEKKYTTPRGRQERKDQKN